MESNRGSTKDSLVERWGEYILLTYLQNPPWAEVVLRMKKYLFFSVFLFSLPVLPTMKSFFACVLVLALMTTCQGASFSMSCSTGPQGQMKCVRNNDPNGNVARAASYSDGVNGEMYAGAGRPDEYKTNYGFI
ncbi:uncharacterized protein NPIL_271031 [Nephila pilipes]|uniref:Uncharacterized protein n=1 Tax=Nephila pilipes TaxID=299642 RepID=A0A8X6NXN6_NEPPI|nr:uncharacterized protein NPIL_271031 [Nephila pilipes]